MNRACLLGLLFLALAGCRLPADRLPPAPLPEDAQPMPYADLLTRARAEASAANEAFYVNRWPELEETAKGLEQTARFLPKAKEVPTNRKEKLADDAADLAKEAGQLREAARANDVKKSNEILQRINLKVRELRSEG